MRLPASGWGVPERTRKSPVSVAGNHNYDAIIIGTGVAGLSTAMQLAARGKRVLALDRRGITSGATRQASGLLGQMRSTVASTRLLMDSIRTLLEIEKLLGQQVYRQTGSIRVAQTPERAAELRGHVEVARAAGLKVELIDRARAAELMPYLRTDDLLEIAWCPEDGYLNPPELAALYRQACKATAVHLRDFCPVTEILVSGGSVQGVVAGGETFRAPVVVNASGAWSYLVADLAKQPLPTAGIGHYYFTLAPVAEHPVDAKSPTLRDRENLIYSRPAAGGLRVGIYELKPDQYDMESLPADFEMSSLVPKADHPSVVELIEKSAVRFPFVRPDLPMTLHTGIMSFTPDGDPLLGEFAGIGGLYHCAGFGGHGVVQSPAIGLATAELILDGTWRYNPDDLEADRFFDMPQMRDRATVKARCAQVYADYYGKVSLPPAKR